MSVMGVWGLFFPAHRWCIEQKNKKHETGPIKAYFPWTENKEVLCFTSSVSNARSSDSNLEAINIWTIDKSFEELMWQYINLTVSLEIWKTMPLATMSQQAHACWELKNWSPSTLLRCGHYIQIGYSRKNPHLPPTDVNVNILLSTPHRAFQG